MECGRGEVVTTGHGPFQRPALCPRPRTGSRGGRGQAPQAKVGGCCLSAQPARAPAQRAALSAQKLDTDPQGDKGTVAGPAPSLPRAPRWFRFGRSRVSPYPVS